jgi:hypothetical protein
LRLEPSLTKPTNSEERVQDTNSNRRAAARAATQAMHTLYEDFGPPLPNKYRRRTLTSRPVKDDESPSVDRPDTAKYQAYYRVSPS